MSYEHILYEVANPVATITLNRPEQLNAWTGRMTHEVADAFARAERDSAVVGIILTGAGRGFCAGADIGMLAEITSGDVDDAVREKDAEAIVEAVPDMPGDGGAGDDLRGTYTYLMSIGKPIIAAINGPVAGMGVPVALACDLRLMSTSAVLTTSFAQRGLIAEWGIGWQLSRLVGPAHALDLLFSARRIGAEEAERIGLVNRAVAPDELLPAARDYITGLASNCSPASIAVIKRQVYRDLHRGLGEACSEAERLMVESFGRSDFREGVRSYLERRPPDFTRVGPEFPTY